MDRDGVVALVDEVFTVDACSSADREAWVRAGLIARRLRGWLDSVDVRVAQGMVASDPFPEDALARTMSSSPRDAARVRERASTVEAAPALGEALANGDVRGAHVDELARAAKRLEPDQAAALLADGDRLTREAVGLTPHEFRKVLDDEVRQRQRVCGLGVFERQCAAVRFRMGTAPGGMWWVSGELDPESGLRLRNRLDAEVNRRFAQTTPQHCPSDPGEKQDFLRAHALMSLTKGGAGSGVARPDLIVVEDHRAGVAGPDGSPVIDVGADVVIPPSVLAGLLGDARCTVVTVHEDGRIASAPGVLNLGRSTRLANAAQRRALLALYPRCAIPGCGVRFAYTRAHHVVWWEHGGTTDLDNLLPLCSRHHHAVHDGGWELTLHPDRTLHIRFPDGTTMTTGPPTRGAA